MKMEVVIPALNEQESIRSIIQRTLDARAHLIANSPVSEVGVTVVSDGSTDRTVEYAREYADRINLIVFETNRGYGAAIMEGWRQSDAELLAFLDADGTCDPGFFAPLCRAMAERRADVVLGCRLTPESRMPLVRKIGNRLFAGMLSLFSLQRVTDSASGMRVVRRDCLKRLLPLPDGLHFTPAMSARAMLSRDLHITEVPMPYQEREGESKLHPIQDGIRFGKVILSTAMLHRPSRPLGVLAWIGVVLGLAMMLGPTLHYYQHQRVEEWMIYRFVVSELVVGASVLLFCAGYLGRKAADVALSEQPARDKHHGVLGWLFSRRWFWLLPAALVVIGALLVWRALVAYMTTGEVHEHWSRFIAMSFLGWLTMALVVTRIIDHCLNMLADRMQYLKTGQMLVHDESDR